MSKIERLLVPGSTELPDCRCGQEMSFVGSQPRDEVAALRIFRCFGCGNELRLTVWLDPVQVLPSKDGRHGKQQVRLSDKGRPVGPQLNPRG
jgi:predicted SpoU family rRNA methylase